MKKIMLLLGVIASLCSDLSAMQAPVRPRPQKAAPVAAKAPPAVKKNTKNVKAKATSSLDAIAAGIQAFYNKTKTAQFAFEQSYKHPFLTTQNEISKGEVYFKAKNMLWRYLLPAERKKEFYIEDRKFTFYSVNDKTAFMHNCFERDTLSASITFLWGKGELKKSFTFQVFADKTSPELNWITLIPKEKDAPVKNISLGVDKKTSQVVESIVVDKSGGINHFKFANFTVNKPIDDAMFQFIAPKDVVVQDMPNVTCPPSTSPPPQPKPIPKPVPKSPGK